MITRLHGLLPSRSGLAVAAFVVGSLAFAAQSSAATLRIACGAAPTSTSTQPNDQSRVTGLDGNPLPGVLHHYP